MERLYYTDPALLEFDATCHAGRRPTASGGACGSIAPRSIRPRAGSRSTPARSVRRTRAGRRSTRTMATSSTSSDPPVARRREAVQGAIDRARRFDHHAAAHGTAHPVGGVRSPVQGAHGELSPRRASARRSTSRARSTPSGDRRARKTRPIASCGSDRPVAIRFVSAEEAAALPLRKEPQRTGELRLIDIGGYDLSACGGAHTSRARARSA